MPEVPAKGAEEAVSLMPRPAGDLACWLRNVPVSAQADRRHRASMAIVSAKSTDRQPCGRRRTALDCGRGGGKLRLYVNFPGTIDSRSRAGER